MLLDLSVFWRFFALNFIQLEVAESRCPMPHVFLDCYSRMFQHPLPNTGSYGTVREHLEVSYSMPCGLQHILHWTRPKRYLKTTMAWTQSCACITSAFRRRTCEENPQITTNATIQLIHRDLAEQVFKMYSGLTWSLLMISDRKLQSCHEPYVHPCQQSCRLESATKTRSQQHTLDVDKIDPIFLLCTKNAFHLYFIIWPLTFQSGNLGEHVSSLDSSLSNVPMARRKLR